MNKLIPNHVQATLLENGLRSNDLQSVLQRGVLPHDSQAAWLKNMLLVNDLHGAFLNGNASPEWHANCLVRGGVLLTYKLCCSRETLFPTDIQAVYLWESYFLMICKRRCLKRRAVSQWHAGGAGTRGAAS